MKKAVFLDRDGVINKKPPEQDYVKKWDEFFMLSDVENAIKKIKNAGYLVIVITNQRGVARGLMTEETVNGIHESINRELARFGTSIDAFYWCKHNYDDKCDCRKPAPGLILKAAKDLDIDIGKSIFIGDTKTDEECGKNAGIKTYIMPTDGSLLEAIENIL